VVGASAELVLQARCKGLHNHPKCRTRNETIDKHCHPSSSRRSSTPGNHKSKGQFRSSSRWGRLQGWEELHIQL